ncbi:MAG: hypothetical protein P4L99_08050 [Chthoniobacter sp.]|nr:hypothetical protein [Chthoniobacter sp.]
MPTAAEAEEHLRVIRSLMEKATIYRAVSAPTAMVAGIAALIVGNPPFKLLFDHCDPAISFCLRWLLALFATLLVNTLLIFREARRRGDPVLSPGMRAALQALSPPMLCGAVSFCLFTPQYLPAVLAIFYGLALLATTHFAPRSIMWLGWSFLLIGLAMVVISTTNPLYPGPAPDMTTNRLFMQIMPDWMMVATFGCFHLFYGICTWPRRAPAAAALSSTP